MPPLSTRILPVPSTAELGQFVPPDSLDHWHVPHTQEAAAQLASVAEAARLLRETDVPVGFPTETVYGLAADVTRSAAVRGIFSVKRRPADNPLIVHVCDLDMVRGLLGEATPLPAIYGPLVERFWPGPLTILLPLSQGSEGSQGSEREESGRKWTLAPEVTAGLSTFGCRMPASPLARTLIGLAGVPLAGPSANASTRPSPTTAQHVVDDLDGRIEAVLDGGACAVGVESTVVDGLCDPPVVLRPGGISLGQLRTVPGWERVQRAYKDGGGAEGAKGKGEEAEMDSAAPRAPGMKYKHYSPKARVVLYEQRSREEGETGVAVVDLVREMQSVDEVQKSTAANGADQQRPVVMGLIRTQTWPALLLPKHQQQQKQQQDEKETETTYRLWQSTLDDTPTTRQTTVLELDLGRDLASVAHGLFSALRDLDARGADVILVEGIEDRGDDMAAAVMNRLRKAASEVRENR